MAEGTLKRIGEKVCKKEFLGFTPTSNATKPPHIANGLFRAITGETCKSQDVHEWMICEGRKGISSEEIIQYYHEILERGQLEKPSNIKVFRFLLNEIFNQDNTTYPSYDYSVTTISSHWLVKGSLKPEANIGDFIFEILSKKINGERSPAIELLRIALANDTDDMTKLVKPIIAFPSDKEKRIVSEVEYPEDNKIRWDSCKAQIRAGFDQLAKNLVAVKESKNSLLVLRRLVNFAVFSSLLYLIRANEAVYGGERIPIAIDAGADLDSVRKASEQSFTAAKKAVEDYYVNAIGDILNEEKLQDTHKACKAWIEDMVFAANKEDEGKNAITAYYESFCAEGDRPKRALAKALQIALYTFEYKNNSPSDFCRVLGVRAGLIGPKGNRAIKRYLVNSFTLETITLSAINEDDLNDGLELKELSEKLIEKYCILIGADSETEYAILEGANIAQSTPGDLRGDLSINAQQLANSYISLGLGKRYADGVTLIGWRL